MAELELAKFFCNVNSQILEGCTNRRGDDGKGGSEFVSRLILPLKAGMKLQIVLLE